MEKIKIAKSLTILQPLNKLADDGPSEEAETMIFSS